MTQKERRRAGDTPPQEVVNVEGTAPLPPESTDRNVPAQLGRRERIAQATAAIELLAEAFPKCFAVYEQRRQPLKVGIYADLVALLDGAVAPAELSTGLRWYCGAAGYLRAIAAGHPRIDLDGTAVGVVTPEQAAAAKQMLLLRAQRAAARAAKPSPPPPAPAPQRLSLVGLKAAAESRRKAGAS